MILTASELVELTGYLKPSLQCRWLARNGYSFDVRADGRPAVSRAHYEARHTARPRVRSGSAALNLAALDS